MPTRTVVFLHGLGATGAMWANHVAALPEFECLAPDLPAHGINTGRPWVSLAATADEIARLIEALPERRAHVVGLSLGGAVAFELLRTRPELLDRVVIDGTAAHPWRFARLIVGGVAAISPFIHRPFVARRIAAVMGLPPEARDGFIEDFRRVSPRSFRRIIRDVFGLRFVAGSSTSNDLLLLAGELDIEGVRVANAHLARALPNAAAWMVPWRLHAWVAVEPALHVAAVRAFLLGDPLPEGLVKEDGVPLVRRVAMARVRGR